MRIAIAGMGSIGRRHVEVVRAASPGVEVIAVRRPGAPGEAPPGVHTVLHSVEEAVACRPEAAIVATPATVHRNSALPFLRAGIPVLIEKPLAESVSGARATAAAAAGVPTGVGYMMRFHVVHERVRSVVASGAIGAPLSAEISVGQDLRQWRPLMDYRQSVSARAETGGGVLRELSHEIDLARWLLGAVTGVAARVRRSGALEIDAEDTADLLLTHAGEAASLVHLDMVSATPFRGGRITGTAGMVVWDTLTGVIRLPAGGEERLDVSDRNAAFTRQWRAFLDRIAGRAADPLATIDDGVAALEIIEAAERASARQRWERLP